MNVQTIIQSQRDFFDTNQTLSYHFRKENLVKLREAILKYQPLLEGALLKDLGKNNYESYMTEIGFVLRELTFMEKNLKKLIKAKRVKSPITDFPSKSYRIPHPYGNVLIISPWNYPVNLTLGPLVGAIASGNTAIIKPSEFSVETSRVIAKLISETFDKSYICVMQGGIETNQMLLDEKFNYIFFTGSTNVGKIVMEKASKHLTPISLELGGKSPAIVDKTADLKVSAKRLAFGKYLNSGQTCIAPDYLLIHEDIKDEFLVEFEKAVTELYSENPLESPDYGSMINEKHFNRVASYLADGLPYIGGKIDKKTRKIAPTVLDNVALDSQVMTNEIFGPILPVISYSTLNQAIKFVKSRPNPLALYLFTKNRLVEKSVLTECLFGGGCVNDTVVHIASEHLPFGGVGNSGMGSYHGKASFDTFSHFKSVLKKGTLFDLKIRYAPYSEKNHNLVKKFLK